MILYYKDKDGKQLNVSAQNILSPKCEVVTVVAVYDKQNGRPAKKTVITESDGKRYFIWNNERIYLGDYWSIKVPHLTEYCKGDNVDEVLVHASIIKFYDSIAVVTKPLPYNAVLDTIPAELYNKENPPHMLFVPTPRNSDTDFGAPIVNFTPNNKELWKHFPDIPYTICDFINAIKNNEIEIVNKNDFIATYTEEENRFNKMSNFKKKRYQKKNGNFRKVLL